MPETSQTDASFCSSFFSRHNSNSMKAIDSKKFQAWNSISIGTFGHLLIKIERKLWQQKKLKNPSWYNYLPVEKFFLFITHRSNSITKISIERIALRWLLFHFPHRRSLVLQHFSPLFSTFRSFYFFVALVRLSQSHRHKTNNQKQTNLHTAN